MKRRNVLLVWALFLFACGKNGGSDGGTFALQLASSAALTPNSWHRTGVFARVFYNSGTDKLTLFYQGFRAGTTTSTFNDSDYAYLELDRSLAPTNRHGTLPMPVKGDYAMAYDGTSYYFLNVPADGTYRLTRLDANVTSTGSVDIPFSVTMEAGNDQLMNLTQGVLIIGTLYDTAGTGIGYRTGIHTGTTYPLLRFYDPSTLDAGAANRTLLDESNVPSGGSILHQNGKYSIVTADQMDSPNRPSQLYAYEWNESWSYQGKTLLSTNGQWSQGLIAEGSRVYVAYHSGQHPNGNVMLAAFDTAWNKLHEIAITTYNNDYTAQRPWIVKVGGQIFVSYDVATAGDALKDWQAHVAIVQVQGE